MTHQDVPTSSTIHLMYVPTHQLPVSTMYPTCTSTKIPHQFHHPNLIFNFVIYLVYMITYPFPYANLSSFFVEYIYKIHSFPNIHPYLLYNMCICRLLHYNPRTSGFVPKNTKMKFGFHVTT
jgi:hypothetical protein